MTNQPTNQPTPIKPEKNKNMLTDTQNLMSMFSKSKTKRDIQAVVKVSVWLTGMTSLFFFSLLPSLCRDHRLPV